MEGERIPSFVSVEIVTWHGRKPLGMQPVSRGKEFMRCFSLRGLHNLVRSLQAASPDYILETHTLVPMFLLPAIQ